ncbi:hypothetical protein FNF27_06235 [Cafeteria roenbergensis]|uniref:Kinesin-like protein n=1 Tax=Cafeteria roenbergensis TaxID=33653 RepID=A0A5A8E317_CAFRO|nr:hypothetical protein FNF27_06235 [Cafeteria roenbergensis]
MVRFRCQVYARLRPVRNPDIESPVRVVVSTEDDDESGVRRRVPRGLEVSLPGRRALDHDSGAPDNHQRAHRFAYDRVFGPNKSQAHVYKHCAAPVVDSFVAGYNATLFAYGQTGSGKTFTVTGGTRFADRGIIPRALSDVFAHIERHSAESAFSVFVSYLEVYNESVYDLLCPDHAHLPIEKWPKVEMREDRSGRLNLRGLRVYEARAEDDALHLLFLGNAHRMTAETPMNRASSRSHCVFTLTLEQRRLDSDVVRSSKLHLVDLAGSERVHKTVPTTSSAAGKAGAGGGGSAGGPSEPRRPASPASHLSLAPSGGSGGGGGGGGSASSAAGGGSASVVASAGSSAAYEAVTRREGRYINLSLHYLEKVILAAVACSRQTPS